MHIHTVTHFTEFDLQRYAVDWYVNCQGESAQCPALFGSCDLQQSRWSHDLMEQDNEGQGEKQTNKQKKLFWFACNSKK